MKKVLVSDYDQTFYLNDYDIEINKEKVNEFRKNGNIFIIATGRSYFDFKNKFNQYNFKYDFVIINHGATILDNKDNIIDNYKINNSIIDDLKKDLFLEKSITHFCCSCLDSRVEFEHKNLTKINVKYSSKEEALNISDKLNKKYSKYINAYYVTGNSVEIISIMVNKYKAVKLLADKLNIVYKNIYTVGDGYSDVSMIRNFNGYAMMESVEELQKVAIEKVESVSQVIDKIN